MGTKNNPGKWDCYSKAEPDEPMFILLGRDPTASIIVELWRELKKEMKSEGTSASSDDKLEEARQCAAAMEAWAIKQGKSPRTALLSMKKVLARMKTE